MLLVQVASGGTEPCSGVRRRDLSVPMRNTKQRIAKSDDPLLSKQMYVCRFRRGNWSGKRDSNPRPSAWEGVGRFSAPQAPF